MSDHNDSVYSNSCCHDLLTRHMRLGLVSSGKWTGLDLHQIPKIDKGDDMTNDLVRQDRPRINHDCSHLATQGGLGILQALMSACTRLRTG